MDISFCCFKDFAIYDMTCSQIIQPYCQKLRDCNRLTNSTGQGVACYQEFINQLMSSEGYCSSNWSNQMLGLGSVWCLYHAAICTNELIVRHTYFSYICTSSHISWAFKSKPDFYLIVITSSYLLLLIVLYTIHIK